jgi:quercetin dioxygenase-like cupin family protein
VAHVSAEGHELGVDLFEMQPGSSFPLHTHDGDHILYGIKGQVHVSVDGKDHVMKEGDSVFIPAEYPHGVKTIIDNNEPVQFLAFGYPHKHVSAKDRMKLV